MEVSDFEFGDVVNLRRATFRFQGAERPYQRWSGRTERFRYWQIRNHDYKFQEGDIPGLAPAVAQRLKEQQEEAEKHRVAIGATRVAWTEYVEPEPCWPGRPYRPDVLPTGKGAKGWLATPPLKDDKNEKPCWTRYRSIGIPPVKGIVFGSVTRVEGEIVRCANDNGERYRLRPQRRIELLEILVQPGWVLHPNDKPKGSGGFPRILMASPEDIEIQEKLF